MLLQDVEQELPRDAGEDVASRTDGVIVVLHVNGIPPDEVFRDVLVGLRINLLEGGQRPFGKDHPPAVGRIGRIAFYECDFVGWVRLLQQKSAV